MDLIERISVDLKLDKEYLSRIAERSAFYYKDYYIRKVDGGKRRISQPSPELKTLQYWVVHNILKTLPVSRAASAYKKGDSIKKHAQIHSNSRFIFHTDIHDFFSSIHMSHLEKTLIEHPDVFEKLGLDVDASIESVRKICFRNDCLCIGAVSSPVISNIIMYSFDEKMIEYCQKKNYVYSRYADDIYISSNSFIEAEIRKTVESGLEENGFEINPKKTKFSSKKTRRKITGIIITEKNQVSIGTERRNKIKKMIYEKLVHKKGNPNVIMGYFSFLKDVEPTTYNNLIIKYSKYCDQDIMDALKKA